MSEEMPKPAAAVEAVWPMGPGQAAWLKSVKLWGPGHAATWDDLAADERRQWSLIANAGIAGSEYVRGLEAIARAAASEPAPELPDDDVHVDWHMTPQEWGAFSFVLGQHADTPYIARLIEAGKVPAPADCLASHCPPSANTDCEYPKCAPAQPSPELDYEPGSVDIGPGQRDVTEFLVADAAALETLARHWRSRADLYCRPGGYSDTARTLRECADQLEGVATATQRPRPAPKAGL